MKRAATYARVSTDDQADRGYSLPSQIEACRQYAESLGYTVVAEYSEDVSGATPMMQRPRGALLYGTVSRREVDAVIVYQVDRLSRDIVDLLVTVRNWLRFGIEVFAHDIGKIESENDIMLVIRGWQGTDERKKIKERTVRGKYTKARSGKVIGSRPPFGYQHTKDAHGRILNFEIIEEQAQIVRMIFGWYVNGDETGKRLPARAIAAKLSNMRLPTPAEQKGNYPQRQRETGMWHHNVIFRMLNQEAYAGVWHYGKEIAHTGKQRPEEDWIDIQVPAIIDRATWEKAQELKPLNKSFAPRNSHHDYLLRGLINCSCGAAMAGNFFSKHRHYMCCFNGNHYRGLGEVACKQGTIRSDAIEADVWEGVAGIFSDPRLEHLLRIAQQEELNQLDPKKEELATIEGMIIKAEHEAREIGEALRRAKGIVAKTLEDDQTMLNMRYEAMIARRDTLISELSKVQLGDQAIQSLLDFAEDVRVGIENPDYETKRRILEWLKVKVTIKDQHYWVNCLAGNWDGDITFIPYGCIVPTTLARIEHNYYFIPSFVNLLQSTVFEKAVVENVWS